MADRLVIAGVEVPRPSKQLFPADGITKADLARYYADVAPLMLPHVADRPINMQRYPDGVDGPSFYEKRVPDHFPEWIETVEVETAERRQRQVVIADAGTLVYLSAQACITPHAWLSRAGRIGEPDQLVFDFDPSDADVAKVRKATRLAGELLDDLGLTAFLKTTGSRGYHVYVPLRPASDFDRVRAFARDVAEVLAAREPSLFTTQQRKSKRGARVLVDVMRNGYGQTAVPAYAVRARAHAPVSTPIEWDELSRVGPDQFTIDSVRRRLARKADPWKGIRRRAQGLDRAMSRLDRLRT
jgi:bifunctional non-homologous end joining protein LigD